MKEEISKLEQTIHVKETEIVNLKNIAVEQGQKSEDIRRGCLSEVVCNSLIFFFFNLQMQELQNGLAN